MSGFQDAKDALEAIDLKGHDGLARTLKVQKELAGWCLLKHFDFHEIESACLVQVGKHETRGGHEFHAATFRFDLDGDSSEMLVRCVDMDQTRAIAKLLGQSFNIIVASNELGNCLVSFDPANAEEVENA